MKHLVLLVALLAAPWLRPAHAAEGVPARPQPFTFVTDQANLIEPADEKRLDYGLRQYADNTGTQVVIVTVPSLGGQDVNAFARQLGSSWGVGQKDKNNGLVVLVSKQEHKLSIEPGAGLRDRVTASVIQQAIGQMTPQFKQNNYGQGLRNGLNILLKAANPNSAPASAAATPAATASTPTDATPPSSSQAMSDPAGPSATPVEAPSPGLPWGTILIGAVIVIGGFMLLKRLFGGNRNATADNGGNSPNFYPNRPNAPQPNQPQGGQPNFYPNQGQPGYGAPAQQGGLGSGMGGILATGAAAAAGAYLGNRLGGDHDSHDSGRSLSNDNYQNEAGLGAGAAAGGTAAAGDDYFNSRDGGGDSAPDYFSNSGDSGSGDYFSGNDNSYDDSSGGGGFDDTSDNSGSW